MSFKSGVKSVLAILYRNRSTIETAVGLGLIAWGSGLNISKARQAADISYEIESMMDDIHQVDKENGWESKKDRNSAVMDVFRYAFKGYLKTYGPGIACELAGGTLVAVSDVTQAKELSKTSAMLATATATLSAVKERVVADQGEEKWQEYLLGPQFTTVDVMPDGTIIQTTEPLANPNAEAGLPAHCFFFDEANINWEKDAIANRDFLENHQHWLNERLWIEGFLFENDIRRDLGAPLVKSGWTSGIFATDKNGNRNYIKLGLDAKNPAAQSFRDGIEPTILIQLNVEDNIIDQIKLPLI